MVFKVTDFNGYDRVKVLQKGFSKGILHSASSQIHQTQVGGVSTVISNHGAIVGHIWDITLSPLTSPFPSIKGSVAKDGILPFYPVYKDK